MTVLSHRVTAKDTGEDSSCVHQAAVHRAEDAGLTAEVWKSFLSETEPFTALFTAVERCHAQHMVENFQDTVSPALRSTSDPAASEASLLHCGTRL